MIQNSHISYLPEKRLTYEAVEYSDKDHRTWAYLYSTQEKNLQELAHSHVLKGLQELSLPRDRIPQLEEVSEKLYSKTGWQIIGVNDLIDGTQFFQHLADRMFPSTIYIRGSEELSLSRDPDIFHELFGHCSLLCDTTYANLFEKIATLALRVDEAQRRFIQRLFWFTFETGLINTAGGVKVYGGSLLSSIKESKNAILSSEQFKRTFNVVDIFRTPYRADILQSVYYVIPDFYTLHTAIENIDELKRNIDLAYELGEFHPPFPVDKQYEKYMSYNICKFIHPERM